MCWFYPVGFRLYGFYSPLSERGLDGRIDTARTSAAAIYYIYTIEIMIKDAKDVKYGRDMLTFIVCVWVFVHTQVQLTVNQVVTLHLSPPRTEFLKF